MFTKRNLAIMAFAGIFAGVLLHSILGAVVGLGIAALTVHFRTFNSGNGKWTTAETVFNLTIVAVMLGSLFLAGRWPVLDWANTACIGAFLGNLIVSVCMLMFRPRS